MKYLLSASWKTLNGLYRSLVVLMFFNWFVASSLGLNDLTFWTVYAINITINIIRLKPNNIATHYRKTNENEQYWFKEDLKGTFAFSIFLSIIFLIGYIVKLFVGA